MPVIDIVKDIEGRRLVITAEFKAPLDRVWALYADPRRLEKVWGPPEFPATFIEHDLVPGGRSSYYMTGPDGQRFAGWWAITDVDEPNGFTFDDGFAHEDLTPNPELPVSHNVYSFTTVAGGTRAVYETSYDTVADLQVVLEMGVEEGARTAIDQIDGLLAGAGA
ncbi:SRPBCC domain-containing protein [Pseudactinotalea sp. HY160]|uniref:SRPBCC family protein n=1 Tax=Pseudactinotalea sp. HY160 TaxID=2654490 RepID=UPI00128E3AC7|nr:SRPBCC domain-containing protein [Pseudactinotalea sp. HY160]MPV50268.1 SRPBCC domain-containing protein [Pseudactinotalea sp. HY160]